MRKNKKEDEELEVIRVGRKEGGGKWEEKTGNKEEAQEEGEEGS